MKGNERSTGRRICLDADFRIVHASYLLDRLLGEGASQLLAGRATEELLGGDLFGPTGPCYSAQGAVPGTSATSQMSENSLTMGLSRSF